MKEYDSFYGTKCDAKHNCCYLLHSKAPIPSVTTLPCDYMLTVQWLFSYCYI